MVAFTCNACKQGRHYGHSFFTLYLTEKGFTLTQAGYAMTAFGAGAIAGGFLGGKLTDRFGFFYVQFFSLLSNGIMFFVLARMQSLPQITVCIFVLSILGESFRPANAAAIAHYSNAGNRIRCYSLNRLAINLGWAIGPAVGGLLSQISYDWLFWTDGCTCLVAAFILYFIHSKKEKITFVRSNDMQKTGSAFKDLIFLKGMFFVFLAAICFFQLFSIVSIFYVEVLHLSKSTIGLLLAMNGLVIFLVEMVLVYKLDGRYNPFHYIIAGTFLIGASFITLNIAPFLSVAIISMLIITLGEMLLFPFINNFWVKRSSDQNRGQYASVYTMAFAAAHVIAPAFSSGIAHEYGFYWLWIINFALCIVSMTGFIFLKRSIEKYE